MLTPAKTPTRRWGIARSAASFERLRQHGQQHAPLRVHVQRLGVADAEQVGGEEVDVVQVDAPAEQVGQRREVRGGGVPPRPARAVDGHAAPLIGYLPGRAQHLPQRGGIADPSGEPAGHADDSDRLERRRCCLASFSISCSRDSDSSESR